MKRTLKLELVVKYPHTLSPQRVATLMQLALDNGYQEAMDDENEGNLDCKDLERLSYAEFKVAPSDSENH
jgi:hypothetical protein